MPVLTRAGGTWADVIPTVVGTLCGVVVLRLLVSARFAKGNSAASSGQDAERVPDSGRRQWMAASGLLAIGVASGVAGTVLNRLRSSVAGDRKAFALPPAVADAPPIPATVQPGGAALTSAGTLTVIHTGSTAAPAAWSRVSHRRT